MHATDQHVPLEPRWRTALPPLVAGVFGVTAGGLVAAAVAHAPSQPTVWLAAYLVLVVGVVQIALTAGQALLAEPAAETRLVWLQCLLFNLGSAGVIVGTLLEFFTLVALGTALLLGALITFALTVRHTPRDYPRRAYQGLVAAVAVSALVGLVLSAFRTGG